MNLRNGIRTAAIGLVCVGVLAGCGSDEPAASEPADSSASDTSQSDTGGPSGPAIATTQDELGTYLVDAEGMTLYLFTEDSPGTSVCEGECLEAWPALEGEVQAGEGVDASLIGTTERSDGTVQATYGDWPLYYFVQDEAAGDVAGQGVNDVWWVIDPEGRAIEKMPKGAGS